MFHPYYGDIGSLPHNNKYVVVKWTGPGEVLFSFTQRGKALSCHFSSDKKGLRHLKAAIDEFCRWAFSVFRWCKMLLAVVGKPSIGRLIKKCGFGKVAGSNYAEIYARCRA